MTNQYFDQSSSDLKQFLDFMENDIDNVRRAINAVDTNSLDASFLVHQKAETVQESAENTGVDESEIVKTLVFIADEPIAVMCPGDKRVSEEKLEQLRNSEVRMAKPSEVREATGYIVGGVSPFDLEIPVYMEETILEKDLAKPAAGSRVVGVQLDPEDLLKVTGAETVDVSES